MTVVFRARTHARPSESSPDTATDEAIPLRSSPQLGDRVDSKPAWHFQVGEARAGVPPWPGCGFRCGPDDVDGSAPMEMFPQIATNRRPGSDGAEVVIPLAHNAVDGAGHGADFAAMS